MIGQVIKSQKENFIIFANGKFYFNEIPAGLTGTWSYFPFFQNSKIEYANFYKNASTLEEACPDNLKEEYKVINNKIKSIVNSFKEIKLNFKNYSLYDLTPQKLLIEYCGVRNEIINNVFETSVRLPQYDLLKNNAEVFFTIREQKLNLDYGCLDNDSDSVQRLMVKRENYSPYIKYNLLGTKVGGMSLEGGSFPILNLKKDLRKIIKPSNFAFLEVDYNAAHLRVMLALSGIQQPKEDIYDWNRKYVFKCDISREESKLRTFKWLYGNIESSLDSVYNKKLILSKYYGNGKIKNFFGREIESDDFHALNYVIASTFNDMFSQQFYKIYKLLEGKKSFISSLIHDSMVIDIAESEKNLVSEITEKFSSTIFGDLKTNVRIGKNFGEMKKWER